MVKESHFADNSRNTSSRSLNSPFTSLNAIPTERKAVSILFTSTTSPSTSTIPVEDSLTSVNLAIIVFKAVPKFSLDSRVVSPLYRFFRNTLTLI